MSAMSIGQFNVSINPSFCTEIFELVQFILILVMMIFTENPSFLTVINSALQSRMMKSEIARPFSFDVEFETELAEVFISMEETILPFHRHSHNPGTAFS